MKGIRMIRRQVIALLLSAGMFSSCERPSAPAPETAPPAAQKPAAAEPCGSADSQIAMTRCWGEAAAAAERRSAAAYDKVLNWLQERQQDDVGTMFRETQARWESYRDAQCESVAAVYENGSIAGLQRAQCRQRLAEARTRELEVVMSDASN